MTDADKPLLIKRYASRRLYNTETSDYVTLEDIAGFIRDGRDVKVVDLKSGDDLTRQYLLQIVAEHESRGENVLPIAVLTDLVRSYTSQAHSVVPQFLAMSFDMLRDSQSKMMQNFSAMQNPISGIEAMKRQQQAFLASMVPGWSGGVPPGPGATGAPSDQQEAGPASAAPTPPAAEDQELADIKRQLAELQETLSKLNEPE